MPCDALDDVDAAGLENEFVVIRAEAFRDEPRVLPLIVAGVSKAHGERLERPVAGLARKRDDRR